MRTLSPLFIGLTIAAILAIASQTNAHGAVTSLRPPRLPEKADPNSVASFPCPQKPISTVDIEACEGRALLKLSHTFNLRVAALWPILDTQARRAFALAHAAWLTYRHQECTASARRDAGGTAQPVVFAQCEVELTRARVTEVSTTLDDYCSGRARTGPYRRCPHA